MKIICENKFCIYFEDGKCTQESVELDDLGFCSHVFHVSIEDEYLDYKRKNLLKKFEQINK